jgi:hypothetical protein
MIEFEEGRGTALTTGADPLLAIALWAAIV